ARVSLWESPFAAREVAARVGETLRNLRRVPDRQQRTLLDGATVNAARSRQISADDPRLMASVSERCAERPIPFAGGDGPLRPEASSLSSALFHKADNSISSLQESG